MAKFRVTDQATGKTVTVSGDVPPTPEDVDAIFGRTPAQPAQQTQQPVQQPMNKGLALANEAIAGGARSVAGLVDIATSPFQALMLMTGNPVPSAQSMVSPKGAFAGQGTMTDIASNIGGMTTAGVGMGGATRSMVTNLLDDASRYGESAFRGVLRQLGSSTPVDDTLAAVSSAVGAGGAGAIGQQVAGANGQRTGELVGGMFSPALMVPAIRRLTRQVEPMIREAAPSVQELRGASSALFKQVDDMGIVFSESATQKIAKELEDIVVKEGLTDLRGETALATQYRKVRDMLQKQPGQFTGTNFGVMEKAMSAFRDISKGTDNEARIARKLADSVDDWLLSSTADDISTSTAMSVYGQELPEEAKRTVGPTLMTARALWRRAKAGELVQEAITDAQIASTGRGGQEYETAVLNNFRNLLRRPDADTKFTDAEKKMLLDTIKGGGIRRTLETIESFGGKSSNYVQHLITGLVAGTVASGNVSTGAAAAVGLTAGMAGLRTAASQIASKVLRTDVNTLNAMVKAGPNAQALARIYMARVPAEKRSAVELSAIFKTAGADLSKLEKLPMIKSPLISDAVALTNAWDAAENLGE